jgi:lysyl-tRNA synthetase class 2
MPPPFWALHADRRPFLLKRARIAAALRQFFAARDFVEVETAALVASPGNETHLHAFATGLDRARGHAPLYLRTSPEFACKKLLAAGEHRIVEFARAFRNRERGTLHHPEFTLVEWYRAHEPYEVLMDDCAAILALAAEAAGTKRFSFRDRAMDPFALPERLTVAQAFARHAGIDLAAVLPPSPARLAAAAGAARIRIAADDTWGDIFSRVLVGGSSRVSGSSGRRSCRYPAVQSPLAQPKARSRALPSASSSMRGGRLAMAAAITDAAEQRARLEQQMAEKERIYGERYPIDEDFLSALAVMPQACGIALGFDRLVMLATGAAAIEQVLWTPLPSP